MYVIYVNIINFVYLIQRDDNAREDIEESGHRQIARIMPFLSTPRYLK